MRRTLPKTLDTAGRFKADCDARLSVWAKDFTCRTSHADKTCPAGWSMFSHSCYLLSGRSGSWHSARKNCIDQGADLVVIDSPEEQNFIASFTEERTWIGLNDIEQEGTWKWVDGTPLTLQYWASGQPDNHHLREDCVHIRDPGTSWNDERCDDSYQWVCEKVL
ncbi:CD209 antigen-like protein A isoform X2 [Oreochromis niloticus]|uniref:CD209 antigen-like protein A isoform X2 n=1 Tax=Oreochromis niloticus TaxID=8128 RepID=UPI000DF4A9FA|nr:CD209 antigen-like protein A isoform X2 [Oreochromis niloticus]